MRAVAGVSFTVGPGEIFGLVGPDGAGKTTLLRVAIGVMDADEGSVAVDGLDVAADAERVREIVGYMPQHFALYGDLSVEENLHFFADMHFVGRAERKRRLARLYEFSRLERFRKRPAEKLSGGMQKKLALSCGMIHTPKLLLLDEPTTGVDPVSRRELWDILYRFADEGVAMVVCTPYMDEAERCHRVALMHEGSLLALDAPGAIVDAWPFAVFEITGRDLAPAKATLAESRAVRDVYPFGDALHVVTASDANFDTLRDALGPAYRAERVRPSFEDVFMTRIRTDTA
ncbi:ABC transporter ATP-binding protein [bacterium]|nr:ABC transporter ATP-binding protein [bacterium]